MTITPQTRAYLTAWDVATAAATEAALTVAEATGLGFPAAWRAFIAAAGGWAPLFRAMRGSSPATLGEALSLAESIVDANDAACAATDYQFGGTWSRLEAGPGFAQFGTGRTYARIEHRPDGWAVIVGLVGGVRAPRTEAARIAAAWHSLTSRWEAAVRAFPRPRPVVWLHPAWSLEEPAQPTWAWAG